MNDATATWSPAAQPRSERGHAPALVLLAFPAEPLRVGEVARLPHDGSWVLGRHGDLAWQQQRPHLDRTHGALGDPQLSRQQLRVTRTGDDLEVENLGKLPLRLNGLPVARCPIAEGDLLQIGDRVLIYVTERPDTLPGEVMRRHRFGEADALGFVGESLAAWALRERVGFFARRDQHVLVLGESGTGKELVANALHALSPRASEPLVARNAATIPESLADAELFGNLPGYPNPGMPGREGLVGAAHGGVLFLDEFGELPLEQQARLLRVMDAGEYTRLGEARPRRADLRVVAATNRPADALKHDVLARFPLRLQVPSLAERREDIPLLAAHLLRGIARDDAEIAQRFLDADGVPCLGVDLVHALVVHPYTTHVRELLALLWQAIAQARGDTLSVPEGGFVTAPPPAAATAPPPPAASGPVDPARLDPATVQEALDRHGGRQEPVWRELGLASRHVLARLVKKHGLTVRGRG